MPATASRNRNRAALTGERSASQGKGKARDSLDGTPSQLRRLLLVLLLTTLALVSLQVYRAHARGALLPPSAQARLSSLRETWKGVLSSDGSGDDRVAYDSSQWKARVNKVVKDTTNTAKDKIKGAKEDVVELGDEKLPITPEELKNLDMEDIQKMFDMLQTASRGKESSGDDDEEETEEIEGDEEAQERRQNSRKERFGRLRKAMGFNDEEEDL